MNSGPVTVNGTHVDSSSEAEVPKDALEPLAIVGLALKFPGDAENPNGLWKLMEDKRCAMTEWPKDRINLEAFYHRDESVEHRKFVTGGHFLKEDLASFDAPFFGISATEAKAMDPQHRLFLETTYHALENAGIPIERVSGSHTGVYTGSMADDYKHITTADIDDVPKYAATGSTMFMLANRLSWFYNFLGPSINMDSACSSSLMALDLACQGLRNRDCEMAVVAGGNLLLAVEPIISLMNMGFLSPSGRCFSFDKRADGYSRGEGVAVIIVKRLDDALRDGDVVRAVIRSTGSNQDGHTPGITQPSVVSQAALIRTTYEKAGLDFSATRYFEAHGTGTPIGDPTEAEAIGSVFRTARSANDPLYIGAVKSNIGHLEGGSGLAGIVKAVMVLEKGIIPPNANFESPNPRIDTEFYHLKFPTQATPWPSDGLRRASVASFGVGGSNCHAVLDDAFHYLQSRGMTGNTTVEPSQGAFHPQDTGCVTGLAGGASSLQSKPPRLLVFSSADEDGTKRQAKEYETHFRNRGSINEDDFYLEHLAYTLSTRRSNLDWRAFALADTARDLVNLQTVISDSTMAKGNVQSCFIFTGQGAQYRNMGARLFAHPTFRQSIQHFDEKLSGLGCNWKVLELLLQESSPININEPEYSQTMTTALQIALYELMLAVGVKPAVVIGHSSGEIAAAYAAGALTIGSAAKVAYYRGKCAGALARSDRKAGAMMSVNLSADRVHEYIASSSVDQSTVSVACVNSPGNVTLSGDESAIDSLQKVLHSGGVWTRKLNTGVAYHSPHMEHASVEYAKNIAELERGAKTVGLPRMISSVTGKLVRRTEDLCKSGYWVSNMLSTVQFLDAIRTTVTFMNNKDTRQLGVPKLGLLEDIVEIGPHSALRRPILDCFTECAPDVKIRYHSVLSRQMPADRTALETIGELFTHGHDVNISKANEIGRDRSLNLHPLSDLPSYVFDHSKTYWHEAAMGQQTRLRRFPKLELLGTQAIDWNPLEAKWRKTFDLNETPWVGDHVVNGRAIYPATGMLVMAIEASCQIADTTRSIDAFELRDVVFSAPISIEAGRNEAELHMCPERNQSDKSADCYKFQVYSKHSGAWFETCHGRLRVIYENDLPRQHQEKEQAFYQQKYKELSQSCTRKVPTNDLYECFVANGLDYGPAFQTLDNLSWDGGFTAMGDLKCFKWMPEHSQHARQPHIAHPVTLDGAGQLVWVALSKGASKAIFDGPAVTGIKDLWISSSGLSYPDTDRLHAICTTRLSGHRGTDSSIFAFDPTGKLRFRMSHLRTTSVGGTAKAAVDNSRKMCFGMTSKADIDLLDGQALEDFVRGDRDISKEPETFYDELELVLYHFATLAMKPKEGDKAPIDSLKPHMAKYSQWLASQLESRSAWSKRIEDPKLMEGLIERVERASAEGEFFVRMGRHLDPILRGLADPLEVMFQDGHADRYYQDICDKMPCCRELVTYMDAMSHKNPQMNILEVGAGTGSLTSQVLNTLRVNNDKGPTGQLRLGRYDYTDISPAFFDHARERFADFDPWMTYGVLNLEDDAIAQGYQPESYDVVVACLVLHATRDLAATIRNVRKLLKPNGKLILLEITEVGSLRNGLAFGTLPGWWLSCEREREWGPCVSIPHWTGLLESNGFAKVDLVMPDYESASCHCHSILITTATSPPEPSSLEASVTIIWNSLVPGQAKVAEMLSTSLEEESSVKGRLVSIQESVSELKSLDSTLIFLVEVDDSYLSTLDESAFEKLQFILKSARNVLWVTSSVEGSPTSAQHQMVKGLARTLNTEKPSRGFVTLDLQDHTGKEEIYIKHVLKVLRATALSQPPQRELEYVEREGVLMIGRTFVSEDLNEEVFSKTRATVRHQPLEESPPLAWKIGDPGLLDSVRFGEDADYKARLGDDEVEIAIEATGVNFRDLLIMLGKLEATAPGGECAGVVTRVGTNCTTLRPGDRVCVAVFGSSLTHVRCHRQAVVKLPECLSTAEAASLPVTAVTAYYSLIVLARLQMDESILIHCAAGGTGQMLLQIAQAIGANVYVTVGTDEKRDLLKKVYGLSDTHIFNSRNTTFARDIYRATDGKGVDVVVNSLSGELLLASWECIAACGRFIELGKVDIHGNAGLPMSRFDNNVAFFAVALDYLATYRPAMVGEMLQKVIDMVEKGSLKTAFPLELCPISKMESAVRKMQTGNNFGKTVLTLHPSDTVPTLLPPRYSCQFDSDATYLIAGGLGGLGRSAARWMSQQGARHLILLSRSGPTSPHAEQLLAELRAAGTSVKTPRCDVASAESLAAALSECADMPPIKGCLQSVMVLQDNLFETMSWHQWSISIRSKVPSSWNLHSQLPRNLSFFIMLSSISGIVGNMGQANYAAGNTYQDGLAAYRLALGERATSIDLGLMGDVGIVAERGSDITKSKKIAKNFAEISEKEFLALLDTYCDPAEAEAKAANWQPIIGLVTPAQCRSQGVEVPDELINRTLFRGLPQYGVGSNRAAEAAAAVAGQRDWTSEFQVAAAVSNESGIEVMVQALMHKLSKAASISLDKIDSTRPLHAYGVDSLLAVELRNWFDKVFKADVAIFDIIGQASIEKIAQGAAAQSKVA